MANPYSKPLDWPFARQLYGFENGVFGYKIPKPKFLFYIEFVIKASYQLSPNEWNRLGYIVKSADRPKFAYKTVELDQYNRKRVVYTKMEPTNMSFTFYDTVDCTAAKMLDDYNRHHFGDFSNMVFDNDGNGTYNNYWTNNAIKGNDMRYWGYRLKNPSNYFLGPDNRGLPNATNFFEEIKIYEFYGDRFSQYSLMNPKIESISYDGLDFGDDTPNQITITVNPEGVINKFVDASIDVSQMASSILPGPGFSTNNFPIAQIDTTSFIQGAIGRAGGILSNLVNGVFGSFGSFNSDIGSFNGLGLLGGAAIAAGNLGLIGPNITNVLDSIDLFSLGSYSSANTQQQNIVTGTNILRGISSITGIGNNSISLAAREVEDTVGRRLLNSIADIF